MVSDSKTNRRVSLEDGEDRKVSAEQSSLISITVSYHNCDDNDNHNFASNS